MIPNTLPKMAILPNTATKGQGTHLIFLVFVTTFGIS